jgi:hypothetical protein
MKLKTAERKSTKIKMCLQGPSGSGKTYSSLLIAHGLCENWSNIAVIDTENNSAQLYSHLGPYKVLTLHTPYTPEQYISAIQICEQAGVEVIILDSITHEWECLLEYHSSLQGNSFTNWSKVTPRHNSFVQRLLTSPCHILATTRTKQDYVLSEKNGKIVPEKVGLKSVQRDGLDYEFTLVFDLDIKNFASSNKDRTGLFNGRPDFRITNNTGTIIRDWCNSGKVTSIDEIKTNINACTTIDDLVSLYKEYPEFQTVLKSDFEIQKRRLLVSREVHRNITESHRRNSVQEC